MPMGLLVLAAMADPGDSLSGVVVGSPPPALLSTDTFDAALAAKVNVAGLDGRVMATLCGEMVHEVTFSAVFVHMTAAAELGPALPPFAEVSADPLGDSETAARALLRSLEAAGWTGGPAPDEPLRALQFVGKTYQSGVHARLLGWNCQGDGIVCAVNLTASDTAPCVAGL